MVVIADAAHAASPSTAQGASMAIEDSVILAQCLRDLPAVRDALDAFAQLRHERVQRVVLAGASPDNPAPPRPGHRQANPTDWLFKHHIDWNVRKTPYPD